MRSGNHAIIQWILGMFPERKVCFLNNLDHLPGDPYLICSKVETVNLDPDVRPSAQDPGVVVYSYEDSRVIQTEKRSFLSSVLGQTDAVREHLGPSLRNVDVLIIRDPFNGFASRLKLLRHRGPLGGIDDMATIRKVWKETAQFALAGASGFTVVKYNTWVDNEAYRERIAEAFDPDRVPELSDRPARYGGGSSFANGIHDRLPIRTVLSDYRKIFSLKRIRNLAFYLRRVVAPTVVDHEAVRQRWRHFVDDDEYRELFRDPEVAELSEALFGEIPGTRAFVRSL